MLRHVPQRLLDILVFDRLRSSFPARLQVDTCCFEAVPHELVQA
jgi:hypothetical protein